MTAEWERAFTSWATSPSQSEQERIENAEKAVKNAISNSVRLNQRNIKVVTTGSYKNRTNVKRDSDIDLAVRCDDVFFGDYPEGTDMGTFGITPSDYQYVTFKQEVYDALANYFGSASVTRCNKTITVRENSYHVSADVSPFFLHKRYDRNGRTIDGYELRPDDGGRVINWHDQHYSNGSEKNRRTSRRYRAGVRIVKALRNYMDEKLVSAAKDIPGFLIECLMWNVPDNYYGHSSYYQDIRSALAHLFNNTMKYEDCSEWGEVSELKYLFRPAQKWTYGQAHRFLSAAWDFVGFE